MGLFSSIVARGYQPLPSPPPEARYLLLQDGKPAWSSVDSAITSLRNSLAGGVVALCPTYVNRLNGELFDDLVERMWQQVLEVEAAHPELPLALMIGLQHGSAQETEAVRRLEAAAAKNPCRSARFIGLRLETTGKVRTHNAAIALTRALGLRCMGWVDDDVLLEPGCLATLVDRFLRKGRGAVGAVKKPVPGEHWSARLLYKVKRYTNPAANYPHACCEVISMDVLARGIPPRYVSDDGFVCFELLDPTLPNPLDALELVEEARCSHVVGGDTSSATLARIRRMLLNHHIFLADYPSKARYYRRNMLFYGFWPFGTMDSESPLVFATAKWLLKSIYFAWFWRVGLELFVRGLVRRPLRSVGWA